LPIFYGKVIVKKQEFEAWFIPGDQLVGMEFFCKVGKALELNFEESTVNLIG
jgi:hypothetical protein